MGCSSRDIHERKNFIMRRSGLLDCGGFFFESVIFIVRASEAVFIVKQPVRIVCDDPVTSK